MYSLKKAYPRYQKTCLLYHYCISVEQIISHTELLGFIISHIDLEGEH